MRVQRIAGAIGEGEPKAADVAQAMACTRNERGWVVSFGDGKSFEIPEPLVFGG